MAGISEKGTLYKISPLGCIKNKNKTRTKIKAKIHLRRCGNRRNTIPIDWCYH